jgi:hypothetical protein
MMMLSTTSKLTAARPIVKAAAPRAPAPLRRGVRARYTVTIRSPDGAESAFE